MSSGARGGEEPHELRRESLCERVHHARSEFERVHAIFNSAVTFNCAGAAVNGDVAECDFQPQVARPTYGKASASGSTAIFPP